MKSTDSQNKQTVSLEFDSKKHMMVCYDDISIGRKIEFDFIKNGLEKNEISIYLTHGDVKLVEKEMLSFGIDVKYFKNKGILKIVNAKNPTEDSMNFLDSIQLYLKEILPNSEKSFRIVGRATPDVGIETAMAIQTRWEKILHNSIFDKLNGSVLCTYDLSQIQANDQWMKWLSELKEHHHVSVIHKNGKTELTSHTV